MTARAAAAVLAAALLLGGCGGQPVVHGSEQPAAARAWQDRQLRLAAIDRFSLQARIAETGLSATRADLRWTQAGEQFEVGVSGPLGVGALAIRGNRDAVEIRSKEGVVATAEPERYMEEKLGWSLPLQPLRYWVLGLPAPSGGAPPAELLLGDDGSAAEIRQNGWTIDYDEYRPAGGLSLPRKLALGDGERRFRIVVDAWSGLP